MKRAGWAALLLAVIAAGFVLVRQFGEPGLSAQAAVGPGAAAASKAPRAQAPSALAGLTLTSVTGQVLHVNPAQKTVLHFMVSSCGSCVATEQMLTRFARTPGVQLMSIDVDPQSDSAGTIRAFRQVTGAAWPYVMERNAALVDRFHVTELDTIVVLYHNRVIFNRVSPSAAALRAVLT